MEALTATVRDSYWQIFVPFVGTSNIAASSLCNG